MNSLAIWDTVSDFYTEYFAAGDSRVTSFFLMDSPTPTFLLIGVYLIFVKVIGPAWMKDRKPFDLRTPMFIYNFAIAAVYLYFICEAAQILLRKGFICRISDLNDPNELRLAELGWWFFFLKLIELVDTVFFVLRKKFKHISTLHILHHSLVPLAVWFGYRVEPASYNYFLPFINSIVHIVMYSYYGLAALGPGVQKYLWWKKYLTMLQMVVRSPYSGTFKVEQCLIMFHMVQFVMVFCYLAVLTLSSCRVSKFIIYLNAFFAGLFLLMFLNFFHATYLKKKNFQGNTIQNNSYPMKDKGTFPSEKVSAIFGIADDLVLQKNCSTCRKIATE